VGALGILYSGTNSHFYRKRRNERQMAVRGKISNTPDFPSQRGFTAQSTAGQIVFKKLTFRSVFYSM
jgi:hypothetical protein